MPAMREGGALRVEGAVSPRVLRMQAEFQAIQRAWSREWPGERPPLREVRVEADVRRPPTPRRGRVAAFFSGGVDSWATVLTEPEITDLIFVRGFDILPSLPQHARLAERVEPRLREAAEALGMPLHVVETNVRELADPLLEWQSFNNSVLCAIAHFFEELFERVVIPTDTDHASQVAVGASQMIDGLWSSEAVEIVDHGGRLGRFQRTEAIAADPRVQRSLRVCWENREGAYNCGRCRKCALTMLTLEALGVRGSFATFPPELDLSELEGFTPSQPIQQVIWADCLRGLRASGRPDLARLVEPAVERGERRLAGQGGGAVEAEAAAAQARLAEVLSSSSWRATAPLRRLAAWRRRRAK
jgi:hypothetical protein